MPYRYQSLPVKLSVSV